MLRYPFTITVVVLSWFSKGHAWGVHPTKNEINHDHLSRRHVFSSVTAALVGAAITGNPLPSFADASGGDYENRDRRGNKDTVIREDYYWMMGKTPPRSLRGALRLDDPQWNAFGSCETTGDGASSNSCTYVSLKQRIPAYSKYGFNIGLAAKEYKLLGKSLQDAASTNSERSWATAASYVTTLPQSPPPPPVDAMLKMVLFASSMLTSPNFNGPSRELLVARFYANEANFALKEIAAAIEARDGERALAAWDFGKDSWNSYFQIVNDKISAKVGDKFDLIEL